MTLYEYPSNPPKLSGNRWIIDERGKTVIEVHSTYRDGGVIDPVEADILAKVLNEYLQSEQFRGDWFRIAHEHISG